MIAYPGDKIMSMTEAAEISRQWKAENARVVFTNGCFDILHRGHIEYLHQARQLGDKLIVGLNNDASVKRLKGNDRPIKEEQTRALCMAAFQFVDMVVLFSEDTPLALISALIPDVLVKGGDWSVEKIVGANFVKDNGGAVRSIPYIENQSSSLYINKMSPSDENKD